MDAVRLSPEFLVVEWYVDGYDYPDHALTFRGRSIDGQEDDGPWLVLHAGFRTGPIGWALTLYTGAKRHQLGLGEVLHILPEPLHKQAITAHFALIHAIRDEVDLDVFRAERFAMKDRKRIERCGVMLHDAARLRLEAMEVRREATASMTSVDNPEQAGKLRLLMEKGIRSTKPPETAEP